MRIRILCTLGPASLREEVIRALDTRGIDLFRINLSHTPMDALEDAIAVIQGCSSTPICIDTEGPQVRCGVVPDEILLEEGRRVLLVVEDRPGSAEVLTLWPRTAIPALRVGSTVGIDFDGALLRVVEAGDGEATAVVVESGRVRSNKAVTVDPPPALPPLSEKDLAAMEVGRLRGVTHYALSFAASADDVRTIRSLAPAGAHVMAKIESRVGVRNMDGIIEASDSVIIDRGDLSREVPLEFVPFYQKAIVRRANRWSRPVYVATNLLESMVTDRIPTVAEANDIANTLLDGVHGLVLAAETAIGRDPVGSVDMILRSVEAFEHASDSQLLAEDRVGPGPTI